MTAGTPPYGPAGPEPPDFEPDEAYEDDGGTGEGQPDREEPC